MSGLKPVHTIIMAAGKGTRLKSDLPKVLHPLFGKPLLERVLQTTTRLPVKQSAVIVGHGREQVIAHLNTLSFPFQVHTVVQEPQLGTGHAVIQVKDAGLSFGDDDVLILSGDVPLLQADTLEKLVSAHQDAGNHLTLLAAELDNPFGYGRLLTEGSKLLGVVEQKDASDAQKAIRLVNTGIYCLKWSAIAPLLDRLSSDNAQNEFYLTDIIALAVADGLNVGTVVMDDPDEMTGVNSRADLARCHALLNQRTLDALMAAGVTIINPATTMIAPEVCIGRDTTVLPGCYLQGDVTIGERCQIGPYTTLLGPVTVGDESNVIYAYLTNATIGVHDSIGPYTHLRDGVTIDDNVKIGNFVEMKNASIGRDSFVSHLAYVGDAELGIDVNFAAGAITANFDPIRNTKSKTIIEDHAKVGTNSVLVAPITVKANSCVAAGSVITQDVEPYDLAIARERETRIPGWVRKILDGLK